MLRCSPYDSCPYDSPMVSADFLDVETPRISPCKNALLPCATAAFTSTAKPRDFAVWCQLVSPCRPSMRFLSISSQVSPSLPPPGRLPSQSWLQVVVVALLYVAWFSNRGLSPHLQRAHAGRTQARRDNLGNPPRNLGELSVCDRFPLGVSRVTERVEYGTECPSLKR